MRPGSSSYGTQSIVRTCGSFLTKASLRARPGPLPISSNAMPASCGTRRAASATTSLPCSGRYELYDSTRSGRALVGADATTSPSPPCPLGAAMPTSLAAVESLRARARRVPSSVNGRSAPRYCTTIFSAGTPKRSHR
jgi:hypothetical protein